MTRTLLTSMSGVVTTVRRAVHDGFVVAAAAVTILLAMILLASGPIYAEAAARSALRRTVADATPSDTTATISVRVPPDRFDRVDAAVARVVQRSLPGADTVRTIETESLRFVDPPSTAPHDDATPLASMRHVGDIESHATIDGAWPDDSSTSVDVAVNARTADALGVGPGDVITLVTRDGDEVVVTISGAFTVDDPADPFWFDDDLGVNGRRDSTSFATFGPFVVTREAITTAVPTRLTATWRVEPRFDDLAVADVPGVRSAVARLEARVDDELAREDGGLADELSEVEVESGLAELLAGTDRSLEITRSSVIGLVLQLVLLAGYALALTAGLLAGTRRRQTGLMVARGAGRSQIVVVALVEGLLLTVPAILAAPWLATQALELLNHVGPLATIDLELAPVIVGGARTATLLAGALAIVVLVWPAFQTARELDGASSSTRRSAASATQRAGLDLALIVIAVGAFWQLSRLDRQRVGRLSGRLDVDPLVVVTPALGLIAGTVLALRVIPLIARAAERVVARSANAVPALASWQVARRPLRHGRAALLLIMATTIGVFAASYSATWLASQDDQATHFSGADIRLAPNIRTNDSIDDLHLGASHERLVPGVSASMPVVRYGGPIVNSERTGQFVLLDAEQAADIVELRDDLVGDFESLMADVAAVRPDVGSFTLPGEPERLAIAVVADELAEASIDGRVLDRVFRASANVVVADAASLLHRIPLGLIEGDGSPHRLLADLTAVGDDGSELTPRYPLTLVGIEVLSDVPPTPSRTVIFDIESIETDSGDGTWANVALDLETHSWIPDVEGSSGLDALADVRRVERAPGVLRHVIETGATNFSRATLAIAFQPDPIGSLDAIPITVSRSWLDESLLEVGDRVRLETLRSNDGSAVIVGSYEYFPTVFPDDGPAIVADLPTVRALAYRPGAPINRVSEYWLATDGTASPAAALLRAPFETVTVIDRAQQSSSLTSDPVARGTIGALSIGFVAAAVFAALGFAVSAAVSARERTTEFALLRALGLTPSQLVRWIACEQGVLAVLSLAFGTIVGVILTATALPLISLTQSGDAVVPEVIVVYPWASIALVVLALVAMLGAVVVVMGLVLRRLRIGSLLRMEDRV